MTSTRTVRAAEIALVALCRAWANEGDFSLSRAEMAERIGYKSADKLGEPVINQMLDNGWIVELPDGFRLTEAGRAHFEGKPR